MCYKRTRENLARLAAAIRELKPTLRGAPADVPLILDERALAFGNNYTLITEHGMLDLLGWVEPIGNYEAVLKNAEVFAFDGADLHAISLDDLIRVKQHIGRSKDRESLLQLLAIKRQREQSHGE